MTDIIKTTLIIFYGLSCYAGGATGSPWITALIVVTGFAAVFYAITR